MPQTRWNKAQTIANADAYNLASDLATDADTLNLVVPVSSQAERDALTPPKGKYAGMCVSRTDLPGAPIQRYDGTKWITYQASQMLANGTWYGSSSNLLTNLQSGATVGIRQSGPFVGTPDLNGFITIPFPVAFPNAVISGGVSNGNSDITNGARLIVSTHATPTLSAMFARVWDTGTGTGFNGTTQGQVQINWWADGF